MVGSGAVAVEATALGMSGLYSDVVPLSCLLSRTKSQTIASNWLTDTTTSIINQSELLKSKIVVNLCKVLQTVADNQFSSAQQVFYC